MTTERVVAARLRGFWLMAVMVLGATTSAAQAPSPAPSSAPSSARSPAPASSPSWPLRLRVRVDPFVTLVAGGASVGVDVGAVDGHWRLSLAGFAVQVPLALQPLVVQHPHPLRIVETAAQVGVFRSLEADHRGLFVGPEIYAYVLRTTETTRPSRMAASYEVYGHLTGGTVLFPLESTPVRAVVASVLDPGWLAHRLFLMPWATLGVPLLGTGDAVFADGLVVEDRLLNWHATVALGLVL